MTRPILGVAIDAPLRRLFDYRAPPSVEPEKLQPGQRVWVPFGRRKAVGVIVELREPIGRPGSPLEERARAHRRRAGDRRDPARPAALVRGVLPSPARRSHRGRAAGRPAQWHGRRGHRRALDAQRRSPNGGCRAHRHARHQAARARRLPGSTRPCRRGGTRRTVDPLARPRARTGEARLGDPCARGRRRNRNDDEHRRARTGPGIDAGTGRSGQRDRCRPRALCAVRAAWRDRQRQDRGLPARDCRQWSHAANRRWCWCRKSRSLRNSSHASRHDSPGRSRCCIQDSPTPIACRPGARPVRVRRRW